MVYKQPVAPHTGRHPVASERWTWLMLCERAGIDTEDTRAVSATIARAQKAIQGASSPTHVRHIAYHKRSDMHRLPMTVADAWQAGDVTLTDAGE